MKLKTLVLAYLLFAIGSSFAFAEPTVVNSCCKPAPIGGVEALSKSAAYPSMAMDYGFEGVVTLQFHVDKYGMVSDIQVANSAGPCLDESAITTLKNSKWMPAYQNGMPVAVTYTLPFEYRLR
ncbi:MAG: energy transducer TonB [Candidatus Marinimicrobia bacterium]|nr:energy transducer TonB [Candidatus Neomarinimicrobiota bacterium]